MELTCETAFPRIPDFYPTLTPGNIGYAFIQRWDYFNRAFKEAKEYGQPTGHWNGCLTTIQDLAIELLGMSWTIENLKREG